MIPSLCVQVCVCVGRGINHQLSLIPEFCVLVIFFSENLFFFELYQLITNLLVPFPDPMRGWFGNENDTIVLHYSTVSSDDIHDIN